MANIDEFPMITRWSEEVYCQHMYISDQGDQVPTEGRPAPFGQNQDPISDEQVLIHAAQQGDLEAFNRLVIAYQDRAYTQAYYLLGDRMAAEDAVQEAFISAYRSLQSYRGGLFRSWLIRIVTNKCLDELRYGKRHSVVSFMPEDVDGQEIKSPYWAADPGEAPEDSLLRSESSRQIQSCLERLTRDQRPILVLVDMLGMSYEEAAGPPAAG